jgi:hypothetical protein
MRKHVRQVHLDPVLDVGLLLRVLLLRVLLLRLLLLLLLQVFFHEEADMSSVVHGLVLLRAAAAAGVGASRGKEEVARHL